MLAAVQAWPVARAAIASVAGQELGQVAGVAHPRAKTKQVLYRYRQDLPEGFRFLEQFVTAVRLQLGRA